MNSINMYFIRSATSFILLCGFIASVPASDVKVQLSTREAFVGMPLVMQLSINNATDYELPDIPDIDGCDVRMAGTPSQRSQVMIVNGRRSENRSVTVQYLITPRQEGKFEIPELRMTVDGEQVTLDRQRFVANRSETGDLLFVSVAGAKDKVYVGQSLELTLRIWIKPFRDAERNIVLSESNMWQMISDQTSWGSFSDRMKELADKNLRPGGDEVLREDDQGNQHSYYLYEITATVYPKRPGRIEADDVHIVVNYPTALGQSRDPFEDFFGGGPGTRRSPLARMMQDDLFASPFSNRLTISSVRPIVGDAQVDATEVIPVPTAGRPADYRGAVGRYKIVTQATPTAVSAGDPITLNIGIAGNGPMDLVQAPPLSELPSLAGDFKVADQELAGFVQDDTKVFSTTIRPRQAGVMQIPAIPFSFFDPEAGQFETAMSEPISITVETSESLSLDAIVGRQRQRSTDTAHTTAAATAMQPDFTNDSAFDVLVSEPVATDHQWWWPFVVIPPALWLTIWVFRHRTSLTRRLADLRPASRQCLKSIDRSQHREDIVAALTKYIAVRTQHQHGQSVAAIGALRTTGMAIIANEVEEFFHRCRSSHFGNAADDSLAEYQQTARELVERIEQGASNSRKSLVRRAKSQDTSTAASPRRVEDIRQRASMLLLAALLTSVSTTVHADEPSAVDPSGITGTASKAIVQMELTQAQQQSILTEAGELYERALAAAQEDVAESAELFTRAAVKYQLLVDAGIQNSRLYRNLGNACLQSHQLGRAIVCYERARQIDPKDRQLLVNLQTARSMVREPAADAVNAAPDVDGQSTSWQRLFTRIRTWNSQIIDRIGHHAVVWTLTIASVVFWSMQILRTTAVWFSSWRVAAVPLVFLAVSLASILLETAMPLPRENAVVVADSVTLFSGDGTQFDPVISIDAAQGHPIQVLTRRGNWVRVKTTSGHIGWLNSRDVEEFVIRG